MEIYLGLQQHRAPIVVKFNVDSVTSLVTINRLLHGAQYRVHLDTGPRKIKVFVVRCCTRFIGRYFDYYFQWRIYNVESSDVNSFNVLALKQFAFTPPRAINAICASLVRRSCLYRRAIFFPRDRTRFFRTLPIGNNQDVSTRVEKKNCRSASTLNALTTEPVFYT